MKIVRSKNGDCLFGLFISLLSLFLLPSWYLLSGRRLPHWDADGFFQPYFMLVADLARSGKLLIWNPWIVCGSPDHCEPQTGAFSPISIILGFLLGPSDLGFRIYWLVLWFCSAWGMVLLTRSMGAPNWGCLLAAAGYAFSGWFTGNAQHMSWVATYAALPWIIWRLEAAIARKQLLCVFQAGAIWGICGLSGHPGVMIFVTGTIAVLWVMGRIITSDLPNDTSITVGQNPTNYQSVCAGIKGNLYNLSRISRQKVIFLFVAVSVFLVIGIAVVSPVYVNFLTDTKGYSFRSGALPRETVTNLNALHPGTLATLVSPYLSVLKFYDNKLWSYTDVSSASIYVGAAVLWLAVASIIARPGSSWRWWLLGLGILGLCFSMAQVLPFRGWLYDYFPLSRYVRHPSMFRGWAIFALVILAAEATKDVGSALGPVYPGKLLPWLQSRHTTGDTGSTLEVTNPRRVWMSIVTAGGFTPVAAIIVFFLYAKDHHLPNFVSAYTLFCWGMIVFLALISHVLVSRSRSLLFLLFVTVLIVVDAVGNCHYSRGIWSTDDDMYRNSWKTVAEKRIGGLNTGSVEFERLPVCDLYPEPYDKHNKNVLMRMPVARGYCAMQNHIYLQLLQDSALVKLITGPNRVYFSPKGGAAIVSPTQESFWAFKERSKELGMWPVVLHERSMMTSGIPQNGGSQNAAAAAAISPIKQLAAAAPEQIELLEYTQNRCRFRAVTPESGYLVLTDRWAPRWRAFVNGQSEPIWGANFAFRAVAVPAGKSDILFVYSPLGYPYLLIASWGILGLIGTLSVIAIARKREKSCIL